MPIVALNLCIRCNFDCLENFLVLHLINLFCKKIPDKGLQGLKVNAQILNNISKLYS